MNMSATKGEPVAYCAAGILTRLQGGRSATRIPVRTNIFSSPKQADQPWGPLAILFYGYRVGGTRV
jgi:hypothetical protein